MRSSLVQHPIIRDVLQDKGTYMTETRTPLLLIYQISWKSDQEEKICSMRTDRQTEMKKIIVAFGSFAKSSKILVS